MKARSSHIILPLLPLFAGVAACSPEEQTAEVLHQQAPIWPDYKEVTLPINLAPIRFALADSCRLESPQAIFSAGNKKIVLGAKSGEFAISEKQWDELKQADSCVHVRIQGRREGRWVEYDAFALFVSADSIDSHLCYRLLEPGYEVWGEMGIYQRDLESYEQRAILTNRDTDNGCMNCHSFNQRDPEQMLFHLRKELGGTYMIRNGSIEKLNTKTPQTISALVYPYWHPSGRYVAFSTNDTQQAAHSTNPNRIEVFDNTSDVVVYDVERKELLSCPQLKSAGVFETFPAFSPDGRTLYFCSADSVNAKQAYQDVHYSLCAIGFDAEAGTFTQTVDTLYNIRARGGSVSFPRVSPDGRWLMFTRHGYGNFSIWHKDADLWVVDLAHTTADSVICYPLDAINSQDVDSYHSWSSNSHWAVFSSRRDDGLYTRPYLAHVDDEGQWSKPLLVPQADVHYYDRLMKSFNIPELVSGPVATQKADIIQVARTSKGTDVKFRK